MENGSRDGFGANGLLNSNCYGVGFECFYRFEDKKSLWDGIPSELHKPEFELSGKFLSRKTKLSSSKWGIRIIRVRVNRVKMTEKWGQIQRTSQWYLVRVRGEFGLSSSSYRGSTVLQKRTERFVVYLKIDNELKVLSD